MRCATRRKFAQIQWFVSCTVFADPMHLITNPQSGSLASWRRIDNHIPWLHQSPHYAAANRHAVILPRVVAQRSVQYTGANLSLGITVALGLFPIGANLTFEIEGGRRSPVSFRSNLIAIDAANDSRIPPQLVVFVSEYKIFHN